MCRVRIGGTFILLFTLLLLYACLKRDSVYRVSNKLQKYKIYDRLPVSATVEVNALKLKIKEINMKRDIRNWRKFGPPVKDTITIVVQVHRDIRGLQYLMASLAQVRYIESVLLVFSHSYYSEHMNRLIHSIDFCKIMQIFYPHSVQLHPDRFPGIDPEDCINGSQNATQQCQPRDASLIEYKHHWWWKANFIFNRIEWSRSYTGTVIFLKEDQYVAPDLLHMLQYVKRSSSYFPDVEIMSLGTMYTRNLDLHLLTLEYWRPPFDIGIAFNRTTWQKITELSSFYCMYNDSSWSYSLLNVFKNFPKGDVNMVACIAPRVISTHQFEDVDRAVQELSQVYSSSGQFPEKVKTVLLFGPNGRVRFDVRAPPKGNGGWTNVKDYLLCFDTLTVTTEGYEATTMTSRFDLYVD